MTSDVNVPWKGEIRWQLLELSGHLLQAGKAPVTLAPLATGKIVSQVFDLSDEQRRKTFFVCQLWHEEKMVSQRVSFFVPNKHLELVNPELKVAINVEDNLVELTCTALSLARFVELKIEGMDTVFSDNYFDVVPGAEVVITCPLPTGLSLAELHARLRTRSLWDSF